MKKCLVLSLLVTALCLNSNAQTHLFHGSWTRLGTGYLFDFDLHLEHTGNKVEGYFNWKFVQYDETDGFGTEYYKDKIGLTAREYVQGTWNPAERSYHLKGYKKDDPHTIIALDEYLLRVDGNGDLGGDTRSHGTWLGRINAKSLVLLDL